MITPTRTTNIKTAMDFFHAYPNAPVNAENLRDMGCPFCGNRTEFRIEVTGISKVIDEKVIFLDDDPLFTGKSDAYCSKCQEGGTADSFTFDGLDKLYIRKTHTKAGPPTTNS